MDLFDLEGRPYITLDNLLKIEGWCESGGVAKNVIASGAVYVNGEVETRKRCKIFSGQIVQLGELKVKVT